MTKIFRHTVWVGEPQWLDVGQIVHVASRQENSVEIWATTDYVTQRRFQVIATGQPIPDRYEYVGTALTPSGVFVWHLTVDAYS